jgi:hypothetical protein
LKSGLSWVSLDEDRMLLKQKVSFVANVHVGIVFVQQVLRLDNFNFIVKELVDVDLKLLLENLARNDDNNRIVLFTIVLSK